MLMGTAQTGWQGLILNGPETRNTRGKQAPGLGENILGHGPFPCTAMRVERSRGSPWIGTGTEANCGPKLLLKANK